MPHKDRSLFIEPPIELAKRTLFVAESESELDGNLDGILLRAEEERQVAVFANIAAADRNATASIDGCLAKQASNIICKQIIESAVIPLASAMGI